MDRDLELRILVMAHLLGFTGVALYWLLRPPGGAPIRRVANVPAEFRRRRRRASLAFALAVGGLALILLAGAIASGHVELAGALNSSSAFVAVGVVGLLAFVGGILFIQKVYACPACGAPIEDADGIPFDLERCRTCGVSFR